MIEELNVRSLEDLLVSEEVAEEKDEGTTIKIREGFTPENKNFGQKNDRSLTEVLTEKNYKKVFPIVDYLDKNMEITPQIAEIIVKKSKSTTYRYLSMLVKTGYVEVSGSTNNAIYKLSKK